VFFESLKKTDIAEPIPVSQMKQKSDSKMKSEKESISRIASSLLH